MESQQQLMTIEQCANFAEVSLETVKQYAQFGLLQTVEKDGQRFFRQSDVKTIFHLSADKSLKEDSLCKQAESDSSQVETPRLSEEPVVSKTNVISLNDAIEVTSGSSKDQSGGESLRIVELLQLSQSLREQLEMVREERDWLRQRLERLEARSEREQMLLLSESETVRSLISQREPKKRPFWAFALPWNSNS